LALACGFCALFAAACGETTILITAGGGNTGSAGAGSAGSGGVAGVSGIAGAGGSTGGTPLGLVWSNYGTVDGMACVNLAEPMAPRDETWWDNHLCTPEDIGLEWSSSGPIADRFCTHIWESSDIDHGWTDNYLCAPEDLGLAWSPALPLGALPCLQISEPSDPDTWHDNYLCWGTYARRDLDLEWSTTGPVANKTCVAFDEGAEPAEHGWADAYLCSSEDLGLYFASTYPAGGDFCTFLYVPDDPNGWADNSLCSPNNLGLDFSAAGPIEGMTCLPLDNPSDPHGWSDNHLCWR
jgi:hypothetical protein